ncbi:FKBP-type peptidyl-prolyl cis-trans isomerase FklB [Draconibacterium orientale]|uniref:Peptidyl-prolyl cis-trans isomerase n=1 Tax=Draconibacterium orientale TaxID=1168034 RepID=X5DXS1_9BACT|nr:FKBP-type peptidyl-prolyl cis-trans isomerase [Draconibacterium orientale]AHW59076.1 peptidylprolyl isomerase [Draconibacterium orientale]SET59218.1 FKBP-type peptidyl-prolyl cis-trans isomerase FklB [Draconibacterium orientale]
MKNSIIYVFVVALIVAATSCQQGGPASVKLETSADSVSYAIGVLVGANNKQQLETAPGSSEMNIEAMAAAFRLASLGEELEIAEEDANAIVQNFFRQAADREAQANLEEGNKFLEENKAREGVTTTESGLQYEVLTEGTGEKPTATDKVRVHYHGTLIDGTVFDSSVDRGEPAVFGVNQVIPGWTEALQLMPVGSKWKVFIPSNLAYGPRGAGADIGPNAALVFEVELLEIVKE